MIVKDILAKLANVRHGSKGWTARCPGHDDRENSLSVGSGTDDRVLLKCFAGCSAEEIMAALGLTVADLFPDCNGLQWNTRRSPSPGRSLPVSGVTGLHVPLSTNRVAGLDVVTLAAAKQLRPGDLQQFGLSDSRRHGTRAVRIPYMDAAGTEIAVRYRLRLDGPHRFVWRSGDKTLLYGLWRLQAIRKTGWVLLVEGESDCWTAWQFNLPGLGIPGKTAWRSEWAEPLKGLDVYLWQEPDALDLVARVAKDLPEVKIIQAPPGMKDLSDAHVQGQNVLVLVEALKTTAIPAGRLIQEQSKVEANLPELARQSARVLQSVDPLKVIAQAIRNLGYGGDLRPAVITYLAATSRLLSMRQGSMPVHLLLVGVPGAGKSYTLQIVLLLLPEMAYHVIEAGSPRVLIYDDADLAHRVAVFSEADSLPAGEDNPSASAIRNLLQDHQLSYKVVVRDRETGDYQVRDVVKPGPTTLITTAVHRLGAQLDSRLFSLDVPDDRRQVRQALAAQAALEVKEGEPPDAALIAYQAYLQAHAPWDVVVPFAPALSEGIAQSALAPRILRDFSRLLSLIKSVAVLRHARRRTDERERLVAEVDDYRAVYDLVREMYEGTVSGASEAVRSMVKAVEELQLEGPVTVTAVAKRLGVSKMSASRRVKAAIRESWLVNTETRRGYPAELKIGEPLPDHIGLPAPETFGEHNAATEMANPMISQALLDTRNTVTVFTGRHMAPGSSGRDGGEREVLEL